MADERDGADFVVRDGGSWLLAPIPASRPRELELDDVLALLDGAPSADPVVSLGSEAAPEAVEPLPPGAVVAPVWMWVGLVTADGVAVQGNDGVVLLLDRDDLRLLDALQDPTTVADLAAVTGVSDAAPRLARLVAAGRVQQQWVDDAVTTGAAGA